MRGAELGDALFRAGARSSARRVGIPAIRSSNRACKVAIAARAAADRSAVANPIKTMKTGIGGRVITAISADFTS